MKWSRRQRIVCANGGGCSVYEAPYLHLMPKPLASAALLCVLFIAACKKDEEHEACFYTPAPRIDYNSWPAGLSWDSAWSVPRSNIPLNVYVVADASGDPVDVYLTSVLVRIVADANDSVLYAEDRAPHTFSTSFQSTVALDSIAANLPATLRITTTNGCGYSDAVVRHLLVTPD